MRNLFLSALLLAGCAPTQPAAPRPPAGDPATPPAAVVPTASSTASSLVFDPTTVAVDRTPDLSRDDRAPVARNGVIESSTSSFNVTTSVQDNTDTGDFNQSTVTQQVGTVRH